MATAIGPFLGGWLISAVSWRLIFFINLPAAAAVVAISVRHVPESRVPGPRQPLDVAGATTISLALAGITYGLIAASDGVWTSPAVLGTLLPGVALLIGFCVIESRSPHAMLPLTIFRSRQFSGANAVTFVVYGALGGALFLIPVVLQEVCGYSALEAGVALLPITVIMLTLSARSAALAARIGPRLQMTTGPLVIAAGLLLLTRVHGNGDYLTQVLPAVLVFGFGLAINVAPLTSTALSAAPGRAFRHRLGRQQRRGPGGQPHRGGGAAAAGGHNRRYLPASGRADERLPQGRCDRRRGRRGRRRAGRRDHPQPATGDRPRAVGRTGRRGARRPALRA